ncbi:MAG: MlaD family protein [Pseudomonadota bacterium]
METRANYVLIGAFTLAGILGTLGFLLWLAKVEVDRQYAYFEVLFDDVSGLGNAGDVRYNGLPVGQVVDLQLDQTDPSKVRVRLEVAAETPIKTDTIATLQLQGVTGVSFVALSGGTPEAENLPSGGEIRTERSAIQSIFEGAPELLEKAILLLEDIRDVVNVENRAAVDDILGNLASASGRLDGALGNFETLSTDLGAAAREVAAFTTRLEALSSTAETTLETATSALQTAEETVEQAQGAIASARGAFDTADNLIQGDLTTLIREGTEAAVTIEGAIAALEPGAVATVTAVQDLAETRLPALLDEVTEAAATIDTQVDAVGNEATTLMERYTEVGQAVQDRVEQSEAALAAIETATTQATETLASIGTTSETITAFVETDAARLANETTATMTAARSLAEERLPQLVDQANQALATVDREAQALSADASSLIAEGTARLQQAEGTLNRIDEALGQAGETLSAIEDASESVTEIVQNDGAALAADARAAAAEARAAITAINEAVQTDLPVLIENVSDAAATANRVIDEVGADITTAAGRLEGLTEDGQTAIATATEAFSNAINTLETIDAAMIAAESALGTAETTFSSVNTIIDEDIDPIVTDIRGAVGAFTTTVTGASEDITRISDEVLAASQSASSVLATIDGVVSDNQRQLNELIGVGFPQFVRFIEEARRLFRNLDRLVDRIERDPGRFLLGTTSSDFSR